MEFYCPYFAADGVPPYPRLARLHRFTECCGARCCTQVTDISWQSYQISWTRKGRRRLIRSRGGALGGATTGWPHSDSADI